jgi:hypothetical protein
MGGHHQYENDGRWAWKAASLVAAGGIAVLGGLVLSIYEQVPNYVPLAGAALLVICYALAALLVFRNA